MYLFAEQIRSLFLRKDTDDEQLIPVLKIIDEHLMSVQKGTQFAVFDFDNTCVEHDIQQALVAYLCRHNLLRHQALLPSQYLPSQIDQYHKDVFLRYWNMIDSGITFEAYIFALRMLVGFRPEEIQTLCAHIMQEQGHVMGAETLFGRQITVGFKVSTRVVRLMKLLERRNIEVCVVSASPLVLVRAAMHHHGIPTQTCIGTDLIVRDGVFIDEYIEPAPVEAGKIVCIKSKFGEKNIPLLGIGDTMNDCSMLEFVTVPVAVDRQNPLALVAHERGWMTITHE